MTVSGNNDNSRCHRDTTHMRWPVWVHANQQGPRPQNNSVSGHVLAIDDLSEFQEQTPVITVVSAMKKSQNKVTHLCRQLVVPHSEFDHKSTILISYNAFSFPFRSGKQDAYGKTSSIPWVSSTPTTRMRKKITPRSLINAEWANGSLTHTRRLG